MLAWGEGRFSAVQKDFGLELQGAARWREAGSRSILVFVNRWLLRLNRNIGDLGAAESILEESLGISLSSGAVKYEFSARAELALLLAETGRVSEAEPHLVRCREILAGGGELAPWGPTIPRRSYCRGRQRPHHGGGRVVRTRHSGVSPPLAPLGRSGGVRLLGAVLPPIPSGHRPAIVHR